jgi:hypothetical protein
MWFYPAPVADTLFAMTRVLDAPGRWHSIPDFEAWDAAAAQQVAWRHATERMPSRVQARVGKRPVDALPLVADRVAPEPISPDLMSPDLIAGQPAIRRVLLTPPSRTDAALPWLDAHHGA